MIVRKLLQKIRNKWHQDIESNQNASTKQLLSNLQQKVDELKGGLSWNNLEVIRFRDGIIRTTPRRIIKLCFDIVESCNLNCAGCLTYAPLASKLYKCAELGLMSAEIFTKDIEKLSQLFTENEIQVITISGGEALLHPDITSFFEITRRYFKNVNIRMGTNGVLLKKQPDSFWEACRKFNIAIEQTKYPIKLDFEGIKKLAEEKGVRHIFIGNTEFNEKKMQVFPLDLCSMSENAVNDQNERLNFFNCWKANMCIRVQDGKMYTCSRIPHVHLFNEYFKTDFKVIEDDYIDIYKAKDKNEIYEFLAHAVPFCRYCKVYGIRDGYDWKKSEYDVHEWADD